MKLQEQHSGFIFEVIYDYKDKIFKIKRLIDDKIFYDGIHLDKNTFWFYWNIRHSENAVNNHGRNMCFWCGCPTKEYSICKDLTNYCPKCLR